jgi:DNA-binding NarL/FixJ family response regulator
MRAFIVEDDESMRIILKGCLEKNFPSIKEYGECESAEQALNQISAFCPDLMIVDISLPGINGIELIRRIDKKGKKIRILVVTGHEIDIYRQAALNAGADDIVSKADDRKFLALVAEQLEKQRTKNYGCWVTVAFMIFIRKQAYNQFVGKKHFCISAEMFK